MPTGAPCNSADGLAGLHVTSREVSLCHFRHQQPAAYIQAQGTKRGGWEPHIRPLTSTTSPNPEITEQTSPLPKLPLTPSDTPPLTFTGTTFSIKTIIIIIIVITFSKSADRTSPCPHSEGGAVKKDGEMMAVRRARRAQEEKEKREEDFCCV